MPDATGVAPTAMPSVVLVVLAKAPVPGEAKTRLTPPYSPHQAAALAAAALLDTLQAVAAAYDELGGPTPVVALTGDLDRGAAPTAVRTALAGFRVIEQRGDGLGARIAAAHVDAVDATSDAAGDETTATLQIGMDTPQVSADLLVAAARRLTAPDGPAAVLGPADDGGWWALGVRAPGTAAAVVPVPMSTPFTFERTRAALAGVGAPPELLPALTDVDDHASCTRVAAAAPNTRFGELARTLAAGERVVLADGGVA